MNHYLKQATQQFCLLSSLLPSLLVFSLFGSWLFRQARWWVEAIIYSIVNETRFSILFLTLYPHLSPGWNDKFLLLLVINKAHHLCPFYSTHLVYLMFDHMFSLGYIYSCFFFTRPLTGSWPQPYTSCWTHVITGLTVSIIYHRVNTENTNTVI